MQCHLTGGKEHELVRDTSKILSGSTPRTAWALKPSSLREAGLYIFWRCVSCLLPRRSATMCYEFTAVNKRGASLHLQVEDGSLTVIFKGVQKDRFTII